MDLETIRQEARAVAEELITTAQMKPGQILVCLLYTSPSPRD